MRVVIFTKWALLLAYPARPSPKSIADAYPNKDPSPSIAALKESRVQCPKLDDTMHRRMIIKYSWFPLPSIIDRVDLRKASPADVEN